MSTNSIFTRPNHKWIKKWSLPSILLIVFIVIIINSFFEIGGTDVRKENSNILAISATIFSAIIGIAFPITLTLISHLEQTYKVNWISKMFYEEQIFYILLFGVLANLLVVVISSTFLSNWSRESFLLFLIFNILLLASFFIYLWKIKSYMISLSKMLFTKGAADLGMIIKTNDPNIVANCTETISRLLKLQNYEIKNDLELDSFRNANSLVEMINKNTKLAEVFWGKEITFGYELNSEQTQATLQKGLTKKYFDSIFSSWELSRNINNTDFAYHIATLTLSQFLKFSKTTNRPHQIQYLLFKYNKTLNEVILSKRVSDASFPIFLFQWYEDWCYQCLEIDNPEEIIRTYNSTFHSFLWENLTTAIKSKDLQYYRTYIDHVFTGFNIYSNYRWSNPIPWALPNETQEIISIRDETDKLIKEFRQTDITDLKKNLEQLLKFEQQAKSELGKDWYKVHMYDFALLRHNAIGNVLFTPFIRFNRFLCAYALYVKNYSFIYNFWNYVQPGDSPSLNSGNEMLPNTIAEILHEFVSAQNDFDTVYKYPLEGYHGINHYYKQYLALLIYRQYTLVERYTYDNFLGIERFEDSVEAEKVERYISALQEFKIYYLLPIKQNRELFDSLNSYEEIFSKDLPEIKIDTIIERLKAKSKENEINAPLDPSKIELLKEKIENAYDQRALFQNILKQYGKIKLATEISKMRYSENIIFPKKFFTNDEASNNISGLSNYADFYLHNEIINILLQIQQNSKYKQIDSVEKFLEDLAQIDNLRTKMIIGFNVLFKYQIFVDRNFEILKEPDHSTGLVGHYSELEVYQIRNGNIPWHSILIIDKENLPVLCFKAPNQAEENDDIQEGGPIAEFKNMIQNKHYLEVIDLNQDDERRRQLIDRPVRNSPVDPKNIEEYENYLRTQVEFVQALSFELEFPENFECWYFNFQEKSLSSLIG